jgi:hypothetical protein
MWCISDVMQVGTTSSRKNVSFTQLAIIVLIVGYCSSQQGT